MLSSHINTGQIGGSGPIVYKSPGPVSIVGVAATFTSLSYANNGGKTQLSSAGVHGLTTSPAVGNKIYVTWSGGTGVSGLYKVLSVDSTLAVTIDLTYAAGLGTPSVAVVGTEITVSSNYVIPALTATGKIKVSWGAEATKTTNTKTAYMYHGNNSMVTQVCASSSSGLFGMSGMISNQGETAVQAATFLTPISGVGSNDTFKAGSVDTSQPSTIYFRLKVTTANEFINLSFFLVEVYV